MMHLNGYASWGFLICVLAVIYRFGRGSKKVFLVALLYIVPGFTK